MAAASAAIVAIQYNRVGQLPPPSYDEDWNPADVISSEVDSTPWIIGGFIGSAAFAMGLVMKLRGRPPLEVAGVG